MPARHILGCVALIVAFTSAGCCNFCDRWCGTGRQPACYQPCVPCCPQQPACCPAPGGYQPNYQQQPTSWSQPRANPANACECN